MDDIPKCKYCGKPMVYNKILEKYECNDPQCWIKRIPIDILNEIDMGPSIPAACFVAKPSSFIISSIGTAAIKSTYNVFRAIGKSLKKK